MNIFDYLSMKAAADFVTSTVFIWGYVGLIVLAFIFVLTRFTLKVYPLGKTLKNAVRRVESVDSIEEFAVEFPDIDDQLSDISVLHHPWTEFKETLLFPGEDFEGENEQIHNTHPASFFFSRESIVAPKLNLRFYNAFPGILTASGILGTFVGLVAGIFLASKGLAADDINEAKEALGYLLNGAALAFITSIAGLLTSMLASWWEKRGLHGLDAKVENLVIALDERVMRLPAEKIQASILRENQQQTKALQSFTNDLAVKFAEVLEDKISKPMGESMELLLESVDMLRAEQTKASDEVLQNLVAEFSKSISGAAGNEMSQFAETLNQLNEVFTTQITSAANSQQLTYELLQDATESIRDCVGEIVTVTEQNQALVSETNALLVVAKESQTKIADTVEPLSELVQTVTESNRTSMDVAGVMKDCAGGMQSAIEELAEIGDRTSSSWEDYQIRFENVDGQLANTFNSLQEGLESYSQNLNGYLIDVERETSKIVTHLAGGTRGLEDAVEELVDAMARREAA